jgi:hypothetical protein
VGVSADVCISCYLVNAVFSPSIKIRHALRVLSKKKSYFDCFLSKGYCFKLSSISIFVSTNDCSTDCVHYYVLLFGDPVETNILHVRAVNYQNTITTNTTN